MVTSPPYNVGKEYDENLTLNEYREFLKRVWIEVKRVLVPGGRVCINNANLGRKPYIPLHAFIVEDMLDLGFLMRGEIIWNKASSGSPSTAWGSWLSAKNPTLRDIHEYILVFSKGMFSRGNISKKSTISRALVSSTMIVVPLPPSRYHYWPQYRRQNCPQYRQYYEGGYCCDCQFHQENNHGPEWHFYIRNRYLINVSFTHS
jgi:hypothetical protein